MHSEAVVSTCTKCHGELIIITLICICKSAAIYCHVTWCLQVGGKHRSRRSLSWCKEFDGSTILHRYLDSGTLCYCCSSNAGSKSSRNHLCSEVLQFSCHCLLRSKDMSLTVCPVNNWSILARSKRPCNCCHLRYCRERLLICTEYRIKHDVIHDIVRLTKLVCVCSVCPSCQCIARLWQLVVTWLNSEFSTYLYHFCSRHLTYCVSVVVYVWHLWFALHMRSLGSCNSGSSHAIEHYAVVIVRLTLSSGVCSAVSTVNSSAALVAVNIVAIPLVTQRICIISCGSYCKSLSLATTQRITLSIKICCYYRCILVWHHRILQHTIFW